MAAPRAGLDCRRPPIFIEDRSALDAFSGASEVRGDLSAGKEDLVAQLIGEQINKVWIAFDERPVVAHYGADLL